MIAPTNIQIIHQNGTPAFAVVPYDQWQSLIGQGNEEDGYIPHEVLGLQLKQDISLVAAWRKYLKISQKDLATRLGVSQPAVANLEKLDANLRKSTLEKLAVAFNIELKQLIE